MVIWGILRSMHRDRGLAVTRINHHGPILLSPSTVMFAELELLYFLVFTFSFSKFPIFQLFRF